MTIQYVLSNIIICIVPNKYNQRLHRIVSYHQCLTTRPQHFHTIQISNKAAFQCTSSLYSQSTLNMELYKKCHFSNNFLCISVCFGVPSPSSNTKYKPHIWMKTFLFVFLYCGTVNIKDRICNLYKNLTFSRSYG